MNELAHLVAGLLAAAGLTVLVVWPQEGPGAWLREKLLRPLLPRFLGGMLDCYVCFGFWCGLALSPLWWWLHGEPWNWALCLMVPCLFWLVLSDAR